MDDLVRRSRNALPPGGDDADELVEKGTGSSAERIMEAPVEGAGLIGQFELMFLALSNAILDMVMDILPENLSAMIAYLWSMLVVVMTYKKMDTNGL